MEDYAYPNGSGNVNMRRFPNSQDLDFHLANDNVNSIGQERFVPQQISHPYPESSNTHQPYNTTPRYSLSMIPGQRITQHPAVSPTYTTALSNPHLINGVPPHPANMSRSTSYNSWTQAGQHQSAGQYRTPRGSFNNGSHTGAVVMSPSVSQISDSSSTQNEHQFHGSQSRPIVPSYYGSQPMNNHYNLAVTEAIDPSFDFDASGTFRRRLMTNGSMALGQEVTSTDLHLYSTSSLDSGKTIIVHNGYSWYGHARPSTATLAISWTLPWL
ncbi:hypothetical protein P153DRAFT_1858 [Dothidotthia symphoricarpi CBS 119687]|uniref:Uncharacterized protein n=1 Tax=Dothidotthia symphoricarpi CBS 119687 TaxID=1392245 RepID=A0A6A6ASA6_9PLEO|nr:uncharacterized protein P153DRAFT_1858 [Dothidotthia symphoricarpi CBS 119687]KAF2134446.1 hypothetical protein P153DRAFT_1858 [Dothidotthia symphoricarpi CBS 119687]